MSTKMSKPSEPKDQHADRTPGYETKDADFKKLMMTGLGLIGFLVFGLVFSWLAYFAYDVLSDQPGKKAETFTTLNQDHFPPEPRLQQNPRRDLILMRRTEDSLLTSFGWVDSTKGIVRVPMNVAKSLILTRGLPARDGATR